LTKSVLEGGLLREEVDRYVLDGALPPFAIPTTVDGEPARIDFHRAGYLWLGSGKEDVDALMANWRVQTAHDARVELLDRKGAKHRFPSMRVDDIDIAAFSPDDGYLDPYSVLMGFRRKAVSLGIRYLKDRAVDFEVAGKRVAAVRLESGKRIAADSVVNASNCWGPELCERVGMRIPVHPLHRLTFDFEIREQGVVRLTYRDRRSPKQDARSYGRDCIPPFARRFGPNDPQR
jgi:FAD-dependent oxidoreductase domain-containing protein 1